MERQSGILTLTGPSEVNGSRRQRDGKIRPRQGIRSEHNCHKKSRGKTEDVEETHLSVALDT